MSHPTHEPSRTGPRRRSARGLAGVAAAGALAAIAVASPAQAAESSAAHQYRAIDLGTLGGPHSAAFAINDHREVVGWSTTTATGGAAPFVWRNGRMTQLGGLVAGSS